MNNYSNKKFISIDKNHEVEISIIENIAWFNINKLEYEYYKTFLYLLKDIITFFSENKIQYIKQYVIDTDIEYFKSSTFLKISDNQYVISTKIEDFIKELINVLGIQQV